MSLAIEPIFAFFIIRHLSKILKISDPLSPWKKILKIAIYVSIVLFIAQLLLPKFQILLWVGHFFLVLLVGISLTKKEFSRAKTVIYAVLPFLVLSLFGDIIEVAYINLYRRIEDYVDIGGLFAVIWMIAMLIISNKQNRALERERQKTLAEEEQKRWMIAKKAELENEVAERTTEIMRQKEELQQALINLKATQGQLIQQEKLASLGELTAGIAHEIQNPLNFVNNFSDVSTELVTELKSVLTNLPGEEKKQTEEILSDLTQNLQKITHHGKRADSIVKGMLQHSRNNAGIKEPTDVNALADEYLRLAYHGLRAKDKSFNATIKTDFDESLSAGENGAGKINVIPQDIGRVILNLITNAFYAAPLLPGESFSDPANKHEPTVSLSTKKVGDKVFISVKDNGPGIPEKVLEKIFQPFFTTKPTGQGTGLGLSISYDIIKAHGGDLKVKTIEGEGAEFIVQLPLG